MMQDEGNKGKAAVPFPEVLDGFGAQLQQELKHLQGESLKPAMMKDIIRVVERLHVLQQMDVGAYTLAVKNYEVMMKKVVAVEEKVEEVVTRVAGYSSDLNDIRGRMDRIEKIKRV